MDFVRCEICIFFYYSLVFESGQAGSFILCRLICSSRSLISLFLKWHTAGLVFVHRGRCGVGLVLIQF